MPYILPSKREILNPILDSLAPLIEEAGDLNYICTVLAQKFIVQQGKSYKNLNAAMGALECCKLELYRRVAAPYEDEKIEANGDVMESDLR